MEHCFGVPSPSCIQNPDGFPVWIQGWNDMKLNKLTNQLEQIHVTSLSLRE
jgi:hypothetical protein